MLSQVIFALDNLLTKYDLCMSFLSNKPGWHTQADNKCDLVTLNFDPWSENSSVSYFQEIISPNVTHL